MCVFLSTFAISRHKLDLCVTVSESVSMLHNYAYVCVPCVFSPKVKCMLDVYSVKQPEHILQPEYILVFLGS